MIEELIALAKAQVGVKESPAGSNNVLYNTAFYGGEVSGTDKPWCVAFIWWLFRELGLSEIFCGGTKTAYCPFVENWAKSHGQWVEKDYRAGDLVLFDWNGDKEADHIGLVVKVTGSALTTIEGNVGDAVAELQRSEVNVLGAYRPAYKDKAPTVEPEHPDRYTVQKGDTLWGIAERLLGAGERYIQIMTANDMNTSLIYPGQELIIPTGNASYVTVKVTITRDTYELLQIMAKGWDKTVGQVIDALMEDAV